MQSEPQQQTRILKTLLWIGGAGLCVILLAAGVFLFTIGQKYFAPTMTVTFEPDYSIVSSVSRAQLDETATILTERAQQMGYARVKFIVTDNNQITAELPSYVDVESFLDVVPSMGLVEFVDFGDDLKEQGEIVITDSAYPSSQSGTGITYHTIMTNLDIQSVSVGVDAAERHAIDFMLTESGKEVLYQYTSQNIGSYLGIVVDKVVISCPRVADAIPDGQGQISGNFTQETAEALAVVLRTKPLPIPLVVKDIQTIQE